MTQIEDYEIYHQLGRGGFGSVHLAKNILTNQLVALKLLHKLEPDDIDRFFREIKNLYRFQQSENVVDIIDYGEYKGQPFYTMKYYPRGSLSNFAGLVNINFAFKVINKISSALMDLEALGGFHRDIKPDNIMVDYDQNGETVVKLSDFGLARTLDTTIFTNNPGGTAPYMSPQALAHEPYSISDDIFSLGITIVELITKTRSRTGNLFVANKTTGEKTSEERGLETLVKSMIQNNPELRFNLKRIKGVSGMRLAALQRK